MALGGFLPDVFVGEVSDDELRDEKTDTQAQIGEAGFARVEAVGVFEHGGEGGEEEIQIAVCDGGVEGQEEDDGGATEHFGGADDSCSKDFRGLLGGGRRLFALALGPFVEQDRRVGFSEGEEHDDRDETCLSQG